MAESSDKVHTIPAWLLAGVSTDDSRPLLKTAWEFTWNGARWTIATDGHFAILARGQFGAEDADVATSGAPKFVNILGGPKNPESIHVDLDVLRLWLGFDGTKPTCTYCGGVGEWKCISCDGDGEVDHECACGDIHITACQPCRGTGQAKCPTCFPGSLQCDRGIVFGQLFNRTLLRRALVWLPFTSGVWTKEQDDKNGRVRIDGDGWAILIMPLRDGSVPAHELDNLPSFEGAGA